jgi:hypothetical protein
MKFWFEAILEHGEFQVCNKCSTQMEEPSHIFVEFNLLQGNLPNPNELHPEPTGKFMCADCGKRALI